MRVFHLGSPPDYEQPPENSIGARAKREGVDPQSIAYDDMLEDGGKAMLYMPALNYVDGSLEVLRQMMESPQAVPGLSDGGAHCGIICDASFPTFLLTHWARDRERGEKLPLPYVVNLQTKRAAETYGLYDRGVVAPGYKADLNVIDFENLSIEHPEVHHDLPEGGRRLMQRANGYEATIVSGTITQRNGQPTGELPGKMVLGKQAAPTRLAAE